MSRTRFSKRRGHRRRGHILRPNGIIHPRVQAVGPEHFGIVAVDCAKERSKWMLSDFYGRVIVEPQVVEHTAGGLRQAIATLETARVQHDLREVIVAIERTGKYHEVSRSAFRRAGYETRLVHPYATKRFRQPANPGIKTDDTDLAAITDIAARPGDGVMFAIDALTEATYTIDPGTGESTLIGPYGAGLRYVVGLAFSPGVPPVPATSNRGLVTAVLLLLTVSTAVLLWRRISAPSH